MFIDWLDRPTIDTFAWTLFHSLWQLSAIAATTAIALSEPQNFVSGAHPKDPAPPAAGWNLDISTLNTGLFLGIRPTVAADHKSIVADLQINQRALLAMNPVEIPNLPHDPHDRPVVQVPVLDTREIKTTLSIPGTAAVLIDARTLPKEFLASIPGIHATDTTPRHQFILIRPTIIDHPEIHENPLAPGDDRTRP